MQNLSVLAFLWFAVQACSPSGPAAKYARQVLETEWNLDHIELNTASKPDGPVDADTADQAAWYWSMLDCLSSWEYFAYSGDMFGTPKKGYICCSEYGRCYYTTPGYIQ